MSERVTRKRARLEAEAEAEASETARRIAEAQMDVESKGFPRDEQFWFADGTVVLVAGDIAFKVYAQPLVDHSPVFKDMLSLPQPSQGDAAEGDAGGNDLRFSHLPGDSAEDMRHVFEVLMPRKTLRVFGVQRATYSQVAAWIRIGHKYEIDDLVEQALEFLRKLYPNTYDVFWNCRPYKPILSIGIVNLARLTGAHDLLPVALLECCKLEGSDIVSGFRRADGTREVLSPADLARCFVAKEKLIEARVQIANTIFSPETVAENCKQCGGEEDCEVVFRDFMDLLNRGAIQGLCSPTPLAPWNDMITTYLSKKLCKFCLKNTLQTATKQRRHVFERLPELMGVTVDGRAQLP